MGNGNLFETQKFVDVDKALKNEPRKILLDVFESLKEKGYDPVNQIVGYILSGDPTYITSHKDARKKMSKLERDELLEEIIKFYIKGIK